MRCSPLQKVRNTDVSKYSLNGDVSPPISQLTPDATASAPMENIRWNFDLRDILCILPALDTGETQY